MIQASELRIGNLVLYEKTKQLVSVSDPYFGEEAEPIRLTEEWLLKFGFEKVNHISGYSFFINKSKIAIYERKTEYRGTYIDSHCSYVHQLQNLYFALTGKELELKKYPLDTPSQ